MAAFFSTSFLISINFGKMAFCQTWKDKRRRGRNNNNNGTVKQMTHQQ